MTNSKRFVFVVFAVLIALTMGVTIWNYTEPKTIAYEVNPITLEMRSVEYTERPITGMTDHLVLHQEQMAIGAWLRDNGFLKKEQSGYWTLLKSYNPRWGFRKGPGRALQQGFDVVGSLSPMPHLDTGSPNQRWVDWCNEHPKRAKFVWNKYAELSVDWQCLGCAADVLWFAINHSDEISEDKEFESIIERRMEDCR